MALSLDAAEVFREARRDTVKRQRGAGIKGAAALTPTRAQITQCGRRSGVPAPACD